MGTVEVCYAPSAGQDTDQQCFHMNKCVQAAQTVTTVGCCTFSLLVSQPLSFFLLLYSATFVSFLLHSTSLCWPVSYLSECK